MVRKPPPMDLYHSLTVAADALAEARAGAGVAALLAWGQPAEIEVIYCRGLSDSICRGLSTAAGRTVMEGVRRSGEPVVAATAALAEGSDLRIALETAELKGLLLVPLFAWEGPAGVVCLEIRDGLAELEGGLALEARLQIDRVSRTLRALQLVAAEAALAVNLREDRRRPADGFDGTIVLDRWERVIFASGMVEGLPGWSRQGPFGRPVDGLPGGATVAGLKLSEPGKLKWEEHLFPPIEEHGVPVAMVALPFAPRDGRDGGRVILMRDLRAETVRREGTSHLLGLAIRLASAKEAVDQDLKDASSAQSPMAGRFARYLSEVGRRTTDAGKLIAQVAGEERGPTKQPVDLNGILHEVIAPQERALIGESVRILRFLRPELPLVSVGPIELQHIITGVVEMARASLRPGGGMLTLRTWEQDQEVYIAVSDDGRGVKAPAGQDAFQPIYDDVERGDRAEAFLKSARETVETWGGRLMLESRPGMWNRVTLMLPAERRSNIDVDVLLPPAIQVGADSEGTLHVLVVDDNPSLRTVIRRYLERRGHTVTEADDGQSALDLVGEVDFDRIVVDVRMPGTDGPTFFKRLDGLAPAMQARTIFMTGGFLEDDTEDFIESTGRPAIQKPFDLAEMARTIEE